MPQSWEIENFLDVKDNLLYIDGFAATRLATDYGTPLFVFSEPRIRHNVERLLRAKSLINCQFKVCYAAKAMSSMAVLQAVKDAGADIEVNSGGELRKALAAGFAGGQIIFNGTSKEVWEIELAIESQIYALQVDSLAELELIETVAERLGKRAGVSLRLVPEIASATHSGLQTALLTSKFGMLQSEARSAFRQYKGSPYLHLAGIHLHIGSQNPSRDVYAEACQILLRNLSIIFRESGVRIEHINLGGGFPVNYLRDADAAAELDGERAGLLAAEFDPAEVIAHAWRTAAESADEETRGLLDNLTLLIEPGRSIVGDAGICLTSVRNQKERPISGERLANAPDYDRWLLTDAGFNILLSMETYKWYYHLVAAGRAAEPADTLYKVAGPLCDGGDVYFDIEGLGRLPEHRRLPRGIKVSDVLAMLNCGAYSLAQASQYNGRYLPAVVMTRGVGMADLIRRRDNFEDLIYADVW